MKFNSVVHPATFHNTSSIFLNACSNMEDYFPYIVVFMVVYSDLSQEATVAMCTICTALPFAGSHSLEIMTDDTCLKPIVSKDIHGVSFGMFMPIGCKRNVPNPLKNVQKNCFWMLLMAAGEGSEFLRGVYGNLILPAGKAVGILLAHVRRGH